MTPSVDKLYVLTNNIILDKIKLYSGTILKVTETFSTNSNGILGSTSFKIKTHQPNNACSQQALDTLMQLISVSNKNYFHPVSDICLFINVGDDVFLKDDKKHKIVYKVVSIDFSKETAKLSFNDDRNFNTAYIKNLSKATPFWFINSDGSICKSFKEKDLNKFQWNTIRDNCFSSYNDCRQVYDKLISKLKNTFYDACQK